MDDKVTNILNRVRTAAMQAGASAEATARQAGHRAGVMVDITRLNVKIYDLNADIATLLKNAGQVVYNAHLGMDADEEMLAQILSRLDQKNGQVMELRAQIDTLKNSKGCPCCGAACSSEDRFCKVCGADLG